MKIITGLNAKGIGGTRNDPRDSQFPKRARFARTAPMLQADGLHAYYQLGDNATIGHLHIPMADLEAVFEAADGNYKRPAVDTKPKQ